MGCLKVDDCDYSLVLLLFFMIMARILAMFTMMMMKFVMGAVDVCMFNVLLLTLISCLLSEWFLWPRMCVGRLTAP